MEQLINLLTSDQCSKKHQEYINEFNKRIACNTEKVCDNIFVNDISSSKSTYENTSKVNQNYEGNKEKDNNDTNNWKHGTF